jgi:hypothetical protein
MHLLLIGNILQRIILLWGLNFLRFCGSCKYLNFFGKPAGTGVRHAWRDLARACMKFLKIVSDTSLQPHQVGKAAAARSWRAQKGNISTSRF